MMHERGRERARARERERMREQDRISIEYALVDMRNELVCAPAFGELGLV